MRYGPHVFTSERASALTTSSTDSDMLSVPSELRVCLETCLSEDASPQTLEAHLPRIREVIIGLLTGLREKQNIYRSRKSSAKRKGQPTASASDTPPSEHHHHHHQRSDSSQDLSNARRDVLEASTSRGAAAVIAEERPSSIASQSSVNHMTPMTASRSRDNLRRFVTQAQSGAPSQASVVAAEQDTQQPHQPPAPAAAAASSSSSSSAARPVSTASVGPRSPTSSHHRASSLSRGPLPPIPQGSPPLSSAPLISPPLVSPPLAPVPQASMSTPAEPTSPKSTTFGSPSISVRPPSLSPSSPDVGAPARGGGGPSGDEKPHDKVPRSRSLAALKQSEALSRRASKRYSAYTMQRITSGSNGPPVPSSSASTAAAVAAAGVASAGGSPLRNASAATFSPTLMDSVSHAEDVAARSSAARELAARSSPSLRGSDEFPMGTPSRTPRTTTAEEHAPDGAMASPSVRHQPIISSTIAEDDESATAAAAEDGAFVSGGGPIDVFLQLGREVKKVKLESPVTMPALRVAFIEKFQYNPGLSDFPDIYIRDPVIGIQYQLEDVQEIKAGSVLSLNIDDVAQLKEHMDRGIFSLVQEVKELRSTLANNMRRATVSATSPLMPAAAILPPIAPPAEEPPVLSPKTPTRDEVATMARSDSVASRPLDRSASTRSEARLSKHLGDVQALRREVGVLRQIHSDFASGTKNALGELREQNARLRDVAASKLSGARAFVERGKTRLEHESAELVMRGDEVQDAIDQMRTDVSVKKMRPRQHEIDDVDASLVAVARARDELADWVASVRPTWKATWSEELATIIAEQQLLASQEGVLHDLEVDLADARTVLSNIQQVAKQYQAAGVAPTRTFARVKRRQTDDSQHGGGSVDDEADSQHEGLSTVMLEVKALKPDPERRLQAIERAERVRQAELAGRKDEFAAELGDFVEGGKLKRSGGVEETERVRQARNEATLRSMLSS